MIADESLKKETHRGLEIIQLQGRDCRRVPEKGASAGTEIPDHVGVSILQASLIITIKFSAVIAGESLKKETHRGLE